jgi:hypothetical protein
MDICYICVIASVSTKAVTGMRIENSERGVRHFHDTGTDSLGSGKRCNPLPVRATLLP